MTSLSFQTRCQYPNLAAPPRIKFGNVRFTAEEIATHGDKLILEAFQTADFIKANALLQSYYLTPQKISKAEWKPLKESLQSNQLDKIQAALEQIPTLSHISHALSKK